MVAGAAGVLTSLHQADGGQGLPHVGGLRLDDGSGNFNFDLEAMGAVEQAGRRAAFGPLPEGWQGDRLWVRFTFLPPG